MFIRAVHGYHFSPYTPTSEHDHCYVNTLLRFPGDAIKKYHKLCGLKQQKFILLQFWNPEVQNEDLSKAIFLLKSLGKYLSLPLLSS